MKNERDEKYKKCYQAHLLLSGMNIFLSYFYFNYNSEASLTHCHCFYLWNALCQIIHNIFFLLTFYSFRDQLPFALIFTENKNSNLLPGLKHYGKMILYILYILSSYLDNNFRVLFIHRSTQNTKHKNTVNNSQGCIISLPMNECREATAMIAQEQAYCTQQYFFTYNIAYSSTSNYIIFKNSYLQYIRKHYSTIRIKHKEKIVWH
jgi:hypothetical protein